MVDERELAQLREENALLRRAALAFGSLAERLNQALQAERGSKQAKPTRPTERRPTGTGLGRQS